MGPAVLQQSGKQPCYKSTDSRLAAAATSLVEHNRSTGAESFRENCLTLAESLTESQ